jgi:NAD(P)-dependent dehydrogenase (short-subunit alcohol dehydrogenase family)
MIKRLEMLPVKPFASIINVASTAGLRHCAMLGAYGATKAALVHLSKAMAVEWRPSSINVNALCPGFVLTDLNRYVFDTKRGQDIIASFPRQRIGEPSDLDGIVRLLACPESSRFINGAVFNIDDGQTVP